MDEHSENGLTLTKHAELRISARRIPLRGVEAALDWGRMARLRGALLYRIDKRSVSKAAREKVDLQPYIGITVVCSKSGQVLTVYRNYKGRKIQK